MNRRQVVAALAGLGLTGGSVWAVRNGVLAGPEGGTAELPLQVETLDAPGSDAGRTRVPVPDTPTIIDLFATWCAPCKAQMNALSAVRSEYEETVAFVSVTNERVGGTLSEDDIRDWWRSHDGNWTVGLDPESDLMAALGADGLPYLALADSSGAVRWTHSGVADATTLRDQIRRVRNET